MSRALWVTTDGEDGDIEVWTGNLKPVLKSSFSGEYWIQLDKENKGLGCLPLCREEFTKVFGNIVTPEKPVLIRFSAEVVEDESVTCLKEEQDASSIEKSRGESAD